MQLGKRKSCSRDYDIHAQGSLLFRLLIVLPLFSSCRSLISFSQAPSLQKARSSDGGSPSHVGSFSSQCLAEQPGLISSPARNNSQHRPSHYAFHLPTFFFCLLLPVFHRSLCQSCEDPVSPTTPTAGPIIFVGGQHLYPTSNGNSSSTVSPVISSVGSLLLVALCLN